MINMIIQWRFIWRIKLLLLLLLLLLYEKIVRIIIKLHITSIIWWFHSHLSIFDVLIYYLHSLHAIFYCTKFILIWTQTWSLLTTRYKNSVFIVIWNNHRLRGILVNVFDRVDIKQCLLFIRVFASSFIIIILQLIPRSSRRNIYVIFNIFSLSLYTFIFAFFFLIFSIWTFVACLSPCIHHLNSPHSITFW